jgi:hypothetical protein
MVWLATLPPIDRIDVRGLGLCSSATVPIVRSGAVPAAQDFETRQGYA